MNALFLVVLTVLVHNCAGIVCVDNTNGDKTVSFKLFNIHKINLTKQTTKMINCTECNMCTSSYSMAMSADVPQGLTHVPYMGATGERM